MASFFRITLDDGTTVVRREDTVESARDWSETCHGDGSTVSVHPCDDEVKAKARHLRELILECWQEGDLKDFFADEVGISYDLT